MVYEEEILINAEGKACTLYTAPHRAGSPTQEVKVTADEASPPIKSS